MSAVLKQAPRSTESMRREVIDIERHILARATRVELDVKHHFSDGLYARELFIPKGTVLTGKIHKHENFNILSKGELSVLTENGVVRVKAGFHVVSPPGTKRIAYAHEDSVWTTIHATAEKDLDKIEAHFIAQNEAEYLAHVEAMQLKEQKCLG